METKTKNADRKHAHQRLLFSDLRSARLSARRAALYASSSLDESSHPTCRSDTRVLHPSALDREVGLGVLHGARSTSSYSSSAGGVAETCGGSVDMRTLFRRDGAMPVAVSVDVEDDSSCRSAEPALVMGIPF